jgi:hypothetical protein
MAPDPRALPEGAGRRDGGAAQALLFLLAPGRIPAHGLVRRHDSPLALIAVG